MSLAFHEHVTVAETEYGAVLLDQKSGKYWKLNPTAALVVSTLLAGGSRQDALRQVVTAFAVDAQRADTDITDLLDRMHAAGLIRY